MSSAESVYGFNPFCSIHVDLPQPADPLSKSNTLIFYLPPSLQYYFVQYTLSPYIFHPTCSLIYLFSKLCFLDRYKVMDKHRIRLAADLDDNTGKQFHFQSIFCASITLANKKAPRQMILSITSFVQRNFFIFLCHISLSCISLSSGHQARTSTIALIFGALIVSTLCSTMKSCGSSVYPSSFVSMTLLSIEWLYTPI